MRKISSVFVAVLTLFAASQCANAVVISFIDQTGSLKPDINAIFSPSGQTFADIGTTLEEPFLEGITLTVTGLPGSAAGSTTFNPNGSFIFSDDVSILFSFSVPVSGNILGHAGWSSDTSGTLTFGPEGTIGPGRNAVNFDRLTVDGLTVSNETGETFFQSSVAFSFTATTNPSVMFTGSSGVLQLEILEVVPEPSTALLTFLAVCFSITIRRRPSVI